MSGRVLVYRNELIAMSETFIKDQVLALRRWRPVLVGRCLAAERLPLDDLDVRFVGPKRTLVSRLRWKGRAFLGQIPAGARRRWSKIVYRWFTPILEPTHWMRGRSPHP